MPRIVLFMLTAILSSTVYGQSARDILEEVISRDMQRKSSVQNYIVNQCTMGVPMMLYYEKVVREVNGEPIDTFRLVPPDEISRRQNNDAVSLTPEEMELFARGLEQTGDALSNEIENSGLPVDVFMPVESYDEPWASPDPRVMTGSMAMFMRAAAAGERDRQLNGVDTDVASNAEQMGLLLDNADLVGTETVEGRPAFHIRADDIDYTQIADDGQQFDVNAVSVWIDQDNYVPLRVRMDGIADVDGADREMFIEMLSLDYQQVGPLYEATRQVMSMGGVLTPEQEAQIADARVQLAEAQQQLNQLSGPQREMMENMLGPQMEMINNLINNGSIQVETMIPRIRVNAGLPDQVEMASALFDTSPCGSTSSFFGAPATDLFADPGARDGGAPSAAEIAAAQEAQQQCLEQKIEEAQASQPRRRGLGGFLGGIGQAVSQLGNLDVAGLARGLYDPDASEEDIEDRARELGLSDEDIAECRSVQPAGDSAPALDF